MAWKTKLRAAFQEDNEHASMGPRFNGVEDEQRADTEVEGRLASMGPRFNGVEDESYSWLAA